VYDTVPVLDSEEDDDDGTSTYFSERTDENATMDEEIDSEDNNEGEIIIKD
jgi:hypothetical protein